MAAGVGKTYRMLQEGRAEDRDVVVGLLETHGRAETAALAEDMEVIPRRAVDYRGTQMLDMDLPAILARAPELCLIDELAHTNAPGLEHRKRYEDVETVLDTGIDVFSTLNVQHLESLNDLVAELSGVRVRETVPDQVIGHADEVVLIDLTPQDLLERLKAGKVYPAARVEAALNGFFRIENLTALRETALRQVAEDVVSKRVTSPETHVVRAAARARPARAERAAAGAPRLALGAAARRRARRPLDPPAGRPGAGRAAGAAPAHVGARRPPARARVRRCGGSDRAGDPRPRHDLCADRGVAAPPRAGAPARAAPAGDHARGAARRGRADRRGPARAHGDAAMSPVYLIVAAAALALGALGGWAYAKRRRSPVGAGRVRTILLPFTGPAIPRRALDAALRLARAEQATLMPAFLATVPRQLPLDAAVPLACAQGMPVLEAIEQAATAVEVPVDARVARGRTYRHALERLLAEEHVDRVIVPATAAVRGGLSGDDLVWLLQRAPAEVLILRPDFEDRHRVTGDVVRGHF